MLGGPLLPWPTSLVPPGTPEKEEESAARWFTSLSPGEQCIVLLMRALVSWPPLVLLDEGSSGMDEGMVSAMWRCLSEGGGVGGTGWDDEVPWVGG